MFNIDFQESCHVQGALDEAFMDYLRTQNCLSGPLISWSVWADKHSKAQLYCCPHCGCCCCCWCYGVGEHVSVTSPFIPHGHRNWTPLIFKMLKLLACHCDKLISKNQKCLPVQIYRVNPFPLAKSMPVSHMTSWWPRVNQNTLGLVASWAML